METVGAMAVGHMMDAAGRNGEGFEEEDEAQLDHTLRFEQSSHALRFEQSKHEQHEPKPPSVQEPVEPSDSSRAPGAPAASAASSAQWEYPIVKYPIIIVCAHPHLVTVELTMLIQLRLEVMLLRLLLIQRPKRALERQLMLLSHKS